jgi:hypothetical protein
MKNPSSSYKLIRQSSLQPPIMTTNTSHSLHSKFPLVLHAMLEDASIRGFDHIVSWLPNSNMFKIHNSEKFTQVIMTRYFPNQTFYKSFLRQLNIYGFERINAGLFRGAYFHSSFVRGGRELPSLRQMERVHANASKQSSYSIENLYTFNSPPCMPCDQMTKTSTPTLMMNEGLPLSASASPTKNETTEPSPLGADLSCTPQVCGGMSSAASPWEDGIWEKYAPSIPDELVGDIISLFGSDVNEDSTVLTSTTSDELEYSRSSPLFF